MIREFLRARLGPEQRRFVKFCAVGTTGVVVNMAFLWLGLRLFADLDKAPREAAASALGITVSVFGNFLFNDVWTWGDRLKGSRRRDLAARIGRYYVASALAIGLQFGCAQALALGFDVLIYAAQAVGIAFGTVFNYVANNAWTFRDQE